MRKFLLFTLVLLLLGGCGALYNPSSMTAEQLHEFAKIKDASIVCAKGVYAGASVTVTTVNVDKGVPSGITVKDSCEIIFDYRVVPPKP